ncbi:hypothetical protein J4427_00370 [Candidatus Woesearchaeota archaeon]|nr:hypothetical protein [Candidatus Woesearchaeota archaeon]
MNRAEDPRITEREYRLSALKRLKEYFQDNRAVLLDPSDWGYHKRYVLGFSNTSIILTVEKGNIKLKMGSATEVHTSNIIGELERAILKK